MKLIVPATSANIGPGFDSMGVALSKYLVVEVLEPCSEWLVEHDLGEHIPTDQSNLLIKTALAVKADLSPHRLKMTSDIPLARGLGSSSSVIVAGIELANQLGQLNLSQKETLQLATELEGHPDNVAPALLGNLVIASYVDKTLHFVRNDFPACDFVTFIPEYELKTSDSRHVLPEQLPYGEAVAASALANIAIAALLQGDLRTAGQAIKADRFHQPYRKNLVKEYDKVSQLAKDYDSYATYLSGAGPTIMTLLPQGKGAIFADSLQALSLNGDVALLTIDKEGLRVMP